jgi:hypothetical protein
MKFFCRVLLFVCFSLYPAFSLVAEVSPVSRQERRDGWLECKESYPYGNLNAVAVYLLRHELSTGREGSVVFSVNLNAVMSSNETSDFSQETKDNVVTVIETIREGSKFERKPVASMEILKIEESIYLCNCNIYVDGSMGSYRDIFLVKKEDKVFHAGNEDKKIQILSRIADIPDISLKNLRKIILSIKKKP